MIDKEKLREFLIERHTEAHALSNRSGGADYFYQLGQAHVLAAIITKLYSGKFEIKKEPAEGQLRQAH